MYKTELERLERKIIQEIVRDYYFYCQLKEYPSLNFETLLLSNNDELQRKEERARKRYRLLTEQERKKYSKLNQ